MEVSEKLKPGPKPGFKGRAVKFVQMHDAFTPLQMAPIMSLGMTGEKAMKLMEIMEAGVFVVHKSGREFVVPFGNISFLELEV